ncbi:MAG: hypothetical protein HZC41_04595 [Chloroflexi bacterium]|nr:hypothetical protein [Chloroflexota bacterium]
MAVQRVSVQDEIYDFLTSQPTPQQIIAFRPSEESQERMSYLLEANRNGTLTEAETAELDEYMNIEHFMRMLKAKARQRLMQS